MTVCLHSPVGRDQSFGARATTALDDELALAEAVGVAMHEALMVRWSMNTGAAQQSWRRMNEPGWAAPVGPLEHALHTFHRQDSLAHLRAGIRTGRHPSACRGAGDPSLPNVLADQTGEDVFWVDTTVPDLGGDEVVVGRVVAPGARRLPADERAQPLPAEVRTRMPHPLG